jgi:O-antigen ligase
LLLCDLLVVVRLVYWKRAGHRLLLWFAFVLISVALVFGLTRGAWVALAVAVIVLLVVRAPRLLLPAGVATLLAALVVPLPVLARVASITDLQDISNYDRLCMGYSGLLMIADRPLLGVGPDVVEKLYPIYRHPTAPKLQRPHLHNSFLQIAAAVGLPALGAFLWLLAASATIAWRSYRAEGGAQGPRADLYVAALVGLCAFAVAGLFEDNWGDSEVQRVFLFLLALPVCARFGARGASPDTPVVAPEGLAS